MYVTPRMCYEAWLVNPFLSPTTVSERISFCKRSAFEKCRMHRLIGNQVEY